MKHIVREESLYDGLFRPRRKEDPELRKVRAKERKRLQSKKARSTKAAKEDARVYMRERYRKAKQKAVAYMGGVCADCGGEFHQAVFDFHHLNPSEKEVGPASTLLLKWEKAKAELDKCVMLCANCHRLRHYAEEEQLN